MAPCRNASLAVLRMPGRSEAPLPARGIGCIRDQMYIISLTTNPVEIETS